MRKTRQTSTAPAISEAELAQLVHERDQLKEFVMVMAGDGYLSPQPMARLLLQRLGITRDKREVG
jgi:hypothetical protein